MKYKHAIILFAFAVLCAFLGCTKKENAAPQEIPASSDGGLHAANSTEEAKPPAVYQVSAEEPEEQAFPVFFEPIHYFQPLAADETLAILRTDFYTTQILAISLERNAYRFIYELSGAVGWLSWFRSYNDSRSSFVRRGENNDGSLAPFYHIDGENGVLFHLFDVNTSFQISFDGRFVAFVPDFQANRNRVWLFSMEEKDVIAHFEVTLDSRIFLSIQQDGLSNFRVFNAIYEWGGSNAEGLLDTEKLTLQMEEISGRIPMFEDDDLPAGLLPLNDFPRLRHTLNIVLPLPAAGSELSASELVNVYSEPDFSSEVIESVGRLDPDYGGTFFRLVEIGDEVIFDGISSHWVYVQLCGAGQLDAWETDTFGWVFLGLLIYWFWG